MLTLPGDLVSNIDTEHKLEIDAEHRLNIDSEHILKVGTSQICYQRTTNSDNARPYAGS